MPLELLMDLAALFRRLTPDEFLALQRLVYEGHEDECHLATVSETLLEAIRISDGYNEVPVGQMRLAT